MTSGKDTRRNDEIDAPQVRLIDEEGEQIGVRSIEEALSIASAANMDLVEIAPNSKPPVCRIMDWGKYKFEQSKKQQQAKKKQKQAQLKEVKIRPATEEADYQVKLRNMRRFLDDGDKVKITLRFRGREMAHQELGREMLERVEKDLGEDIVVEQHPRMEGRQMVMMVSPRRT